MMTEEKLEELLARAERAAEVTFPAELAKELIRLALLGKSLDQEWEPTEACPTVWRPKL